MRALGALLIAAAFSFFGFSFSRSLCMRVKLLRSAIAYITAVSEQMRISRRELPEILESVGGEIYVKNGVFYGTDALSKREKAVLSEFSSQLGRTDLQSQLRAANRCLAILGEILKTAESDQKQYSRLSVSLSVLSGVFVAVLII